MATPSERWELQQSERWDDAAQVSETSSGWSSPAVSNPQSASRSRPGKGQRPRSPKTTPGRRPRSSPHSSRRSPRSPRSPRSAHRVGGAGDATALKLRTAVDENRRPFAKSITVTVRVLVCESGHGVAGVTVDVRTSDGRLLSSGETADDGKVNLGIFLNCPTTLRVLTSRPGYLTSSTEVAASYSNDRGVIPVVIDTKRHQIRPRVRVVVSNALTGQRLGGVHLQLRSLESGLLVCEHTTAEADGISSWVQESSVGGRFQLTASKPGYLALEAPRVLHLTEEQAVRELALSLRPNGIASTLRLRVVGRSRGDGSEGAAATPPTGGIEGASVAVWGGVGGGATKEPLQRRAREDGQAAAPARGAAGAVVAATTGATTSATEAAALAASTAGLKLAEAGATAADALLGFATTSDLGAAELRLYVPEPTRLRLSVSRPGFVPHVQLVHLLRDDHERHLDIEVNLVAEIVRSSLIVNVVNSRTGAPVDEAEITVRSGGCSADTSSSSKPFATAITPHSGVFQCDVDLSQAPGRSLSVRAESAGFRVATRTVRLPGSGREAHAAGPINVDIGLEPQSDDTLELTLAVGSRANVVGVVRVETDLTLRDLRAVIRDAQLGTDIPETYAFVGPSGAPLAMHLERLRRAVHSAPLVLLAPRRSVQPYLLSVGDDEIQFRWKQPIFPGQRRWCQVHISCGGETEEQTRNAVEEYRATPGGEDEASAGASDPMTLSRGCSGTLVSYSWVKMAVTAFQGKPLVPGTTYTVQISSDVGFGPTTAAVLKVKTAAQEPHVRQVGDRILVREPGIAFLPNSCILAPVSVPILAELAALMLSRIGIHIEVQGHVNGGMNSRIAKDTSTRRAKVVCEFLLERGIDASRMKFAGYGDEKMLHNPRGPKAFLNRRVEIKVHKVPPP